MRADHHPGVGIAAYTPPDRDYVPPRPHPRHTARVNDAPVSLGSPPEADEARRRSQAPSASRLNHIRRSLRGLSWQQLNEQDRAALAAEEAAEQEGDAS